MVALMSIGPLSGALASHPMPNCMLNWRILNMLLAVSGSLVLECRRLHSLLHGIRAFATRLQQLLFGMEYHFWTFIRALRSPLPPIHGLREPVHGRLAALLRGAPHTGSGRPFPCAIRPRI